MALLSTSFLSKYDNTRPKNAGPLFEWVYFTKYCRWIEEEKRRETWAETVARVVNYNLSLYSGPASKDELIKEAELMFDNIFHLKTYPAGRSLWIAGTKASELHPEANLNCFARETEFLTEEGYKTFKDFNTGDSVKVLGRFGGWKDAKVYNYGPSKLFKLTLKYGKARKEIYTTANHRWIVRKYGSHKDWTNVDKTTSQLQENDSLIIVRRFASVNGGIKPCDIAIQHGLVYGDGDFIKKRGCCEITLCDDSQQFTPLFTTGTISNQGNRGGKIRERQTNILGLPYFWKQLPSLKANPEYLLGFLMGWFAADGCYKKNSSATLSSANKESLEWARSAFALLGLYTSEVTIQRELSPFDGTYKPLYRLNIYKYGLFKDFFLKDKHYEAFEEDEADIERFWKVVSIEETDRYEDVWCIREPEQECFTLSNGILTRNCTMLEIDSIESFCDLFHLLMVGAGVGFRILEDDIAKLPKFNSNVKIFHDNYKTIYPMYKYDNTEVEMYTGVRKIHIGDSKKGWVDALRIFLNMIKGEDTKYPQLIEFNYNRIRPAGERIHTFGGRAAGHEGLQDMFDKLVNLIQQCNGKLTPTAAMDLCNIIAQNVVVGGGRRSAQIALGPDTDYEFINAKVDLSNDLSHRRMSNNSIVLKDTPTRDKVGEILDRVRSSWEPGFLNMKAASSRRPWFAAVNPCGEILGANKGNCNLSGTFVTSFVYKGLLDWEGLEQSHRLAARIGMRQTNITLSLPEWDKVHKRDRLIGVSVTGLMDALDRLGWHYKSPQARYLYKQLRYWANDEADKYSYEMRIPRPLLVTTIKPEGTISLLSTVSPGLHRAYAPYFIRRIKLSKMDPVCKVFKHLGIESEQDTKKPDRVVFSFPISSGANTVANDEPAVDQLDRYLTLMRDYVDHNASCTLTVGPDEWEAMGDMIHENWDDIVAIALANKNLEENGNYDQLPYEAISKEKYDEMASKFPDLSNCLDLINKAEQGIEFEYDEDDGNIATTSIECSGGHCPLR